MKNKTTGIARNLEVDIVNNPFFMDEIIDLAICQDDDRKIKKALAMLSGNNDGFFLTFELDFAYTSQDLDLGGFELKNIFAEVSEKDISFVFVDRDGNEVNSCSVSSMMYS